MAADFAANYQANSRNGTPVGAALRGRTNPDIVSHMSGSILPSPFLRTALLGGLLLRLARR